MVNKGLSRKQGRLFLKSATALPESSEKQKRGSPAYQDSPFSPSAFGTAKERRKQTSEITASRMKIE